MDTVAKNQLNYFASIPRPPPEECNFIAICTKINHLQGSTFKARPQEITAKYKAF